MRKIPTATSTIRGTAAPTPAPMPMPVQSLSGLAGFCDVVAVVDSAAIVGLATVGLPDMLPVTVRTLDTSIVDSDTETERVVDELDEPGINDFVADELVEEIVVEKSVGVVIVDVKEVAVPLVALAEAEAAKSQSLATNSRL